MPNDPLVKLLDPVVQFSRPLSGDRDRRTEGDSVRIAGDWIPGLAIARKAGTPRKWDKRPGYGLSGATLIYMGLDLSEFQIDVSIWTQAQMSEWIALYRKHLQPIKPPTTLATPGNFLPATQPKALGIYNPFLAQIDIDAVEISNVSQFEYLESEDMYGCTIDCVVYRPPVPILARPLGKIPDASKPRPNAKDKAEEEIQRLMNQAEKLENNLARGG